MRKTHLFILLGILVLALFLRVHGLSKDGLSTDEAATLNAIVGQSYGDVFYNTFFIGQILPGIYPSNLDLPVFYLLLKGWIGLFHPTDFLARLFSAIFGVFSVFAVYALGKELYDSKTGLIAAFFVCISLSHVYYSQEARLYSFLFFLTVCSTFFFIKMLKTSETKDYLFYALFSSLGVFTHYPFIFLLFANGSYLIFCYIARLHQQSIKKSLSVFFLVSSLYLFLLLRLLHPKFVAAHFSSSLTPYKLLKMWTEFNTRVSPSLELRESITSLNFHSFGVEGWLLLLSALLLTFVLTSLFIIGTIQLAKKKEYFLLFLFFVPFITHFILLYKTISSFTSLGYVLFTLSAYFIIISRTLLSLKNIHRYLIIALILVLSIIPSLAYYENPRYPQIKEAIHYLEQRRVNEPIFLQIYSVQSVFSHYSTTLDGKYSPLHNLSAAQLKSKGLDSFWLVSSLTKYYDPKGEIKKYFDDAFYLSDELHYYDVDIYHYLSKEEGNFTR